MATLTERLQKTRQIIASRGGFGGSVGVIDEAIKALESGADVGDLLEKVDRLIEERDAAIQERNEALAKLRSVSIGTGAGE